MDKTTAKKTDKTIELSTFDIYIFKVAKHHYGQSDKIETLKKIINKICLIENTSDFDVFSAVNYCFNNYVENSYTRRESLERAFMDYNKGFNRKESITMNDLTLSMLGAISTIKIINENDELIFDMEAEKVEI